MLSSSKAILSFQAQRRSAQKTELLRLCWEEKEEKKKGCSGCPFPDCFNFPAGPRFAPEL